MRKIKTGYKSGYEMNKENSAPLNYKTFTDQLRFNV